MKRLLLTVLAATVIISGYSQSVIRLDQMEMSNATLGWGSAVGINKSISGNPLTIAGSTYAHGVGSHAAGAIYILTNGATRFTAKVGVDSEVGDGKGSVIFQVVGDNKSVLWSSRELHGGDSAQTVNVAIGKHKSLTLYASSNGSIHYDHADWVNAQFHYTGKAPETVGQPNPTILSKKLHYVKTGNPFLMRFGVLGFSPKVTISGLPAEYKFDPIRNWISGKSSIAKEIPFKIKVENEFGFDSINATISIQDSLLFSTPPMGWMSWNFYGSDICDSIFRRQAKAIVSNGLDKLGYNYVFMDDNWQAPSRDSNGNIQVNESRFPQGLKDLTDFIHSKGLKAGIYSCPAPTTCVGALGSLGYETKDAESYAKWGYDYLKYDYCGAPSEVDTAAIRYAKMSNALKATGREMGFGACEWGERKPWLWAAERSNANVWRMDYDIHDCWIASTGAGIYDAISHSAGIEYYSGPGRWNDMDMIVVGLNGETEIGNLGATSKIGVTEYKTQMGMWSLLASPLILSNDLANMDQTTKEIITNQEVIAVNQDVLGDQASRVTKNGTREVWVKQLTDNRIAVGLLNADDSVNQSVTIDWATLKIAGQYTIRDVFNRVDLPKSSSSYTAKNLTPHALQLVILSPVHKK